MVIHDIVEEVASEKGLEPTELPPLYDVIEPEHIETIVDAEDATIRYVELVFAGCTVTVTEGGEVTVG